MSGLRTIGMPPHAYARPVLERLTALGLFDARVDVSARLALQLRKHSLFAALLGPIDYARNSSDYILLPYAGIVSSGASGPVTLIVNQGARQIKTLAADPASASEIVLARIILAEQFDAFPAVLPVADALRSVPGRADAALVQGDVPASRGGKAYSVLDLVEEWVELTSLPYCYALWCAQPRSLSPEEVSAIVDVHRALEQQARLEDQGNGFEYGLTDDGAESLREFFTYAFYHGILPDVPDLSYYTSPDGDDSDEAPGL